ncbi:MAG: helix-turn-helix transcriptional regulator [Oscillospiraceae bacterium]|nr:helix-turn-helix transcriptional regulator [Oscillospiraceae bacterium]
MSRHIRDSLMTLVVCLVTEQLSQRFPNRSKMAQVCSLPETGEWFDADLENFLMRNYRSKLSREAVAKHIGISAAQLSRIIRKNYGTNYANLMTSLRMRDAKKLLSTGKTITEIGKLLGYTTYNGFAAAFKKYYKTTPENMRKELSDL